MWGRGMPVPQLSPEQQREKDVAYALRCLAQGIADFCAMQKGADKIQLMAEALLPPPTGSGVIRVLPGGVRLMRRTLVEAVREIASRHGMAARTTDRR